MIVLTARSRRRALFSAPSDGRQPDRRVAGTLPKQRGNSAAPQVAKEIKTQAGWSVPEKEPARAPALAKAPRPAPSTQQIGR